MNLNPINRIDFFLYLNKFKKHCPLIIIVKKNNNALVKIVKLKDSERLNKFSLKHRVCFSDVVLYECVYLINDI